MKINSLQHPQPGQTPDRLARWWMEWQRSNLIRVGALIRRLRPDHVLRKHLETGVRGEFEALFFLRQQGLQVIERRWRSPELNGDLDLIAWEGKTLCFVEVKARTQRDLMPASSAVDSYKRRMLSLMASAFLRTRSQADRTQVLIRFDIVSVYLLPSGIECELLRDAFPWQHASTSQPA